MSRPDANWPAVYHIRVDLQREKDDLLLAMREMMFQDYWGGKNPEQDEILQHITDRIETITTILNRINTGAYRL